MTDILNSPNIATAIKVADKGHWHALRAKNIGGSEIAALFNCSPYMTEFELWHRKKGTVKAPNFDNERIKWGNRLEHAIAMGIADDHDWMVRKVHRYMVHKSISGMGASLDYEIFNHPNGMGALEIKNIDRLVWYNDWEHGESNEAPLHIELQLQHQLAVSGYKWGAIGCLVGGNEPHIIVRERHEKIIKTIEQKVKSFWLSIEDNEPPKANLNKDLKTIEQVYSADTTVLQYTQEMDFDALCCDYKRAADASKQAAEDQECAKAALIQWLNKQGLESVYSDLWEATYKEQTRKETIQKACTFRVLRVKEKLTNE